MVDGLLEEAAWRRAPNLSSLVVWTMDSAASVPTRIWLAHDEANLYLAARCFEPHLAKLRTMAAKRDVEVWRPFRR